MLKTIFLVVYLGTFAPGLAGDELLGKGLWSLISIGECPDENLTKEVFKADVRKHKLSRTQDGLNAHIIITEEINNSYELYLNLCKYVDGGCKPCSVVSGNLVQLSDQYAKEHIVRALKMANFSTDYFPLPPGEYDLKDYMIDYCDMLTVFPFGRYQYLAYFILNQQRVACMKLIVEFKKCDGDEDYCGNELVAL